MQTIAHVVVKAAQDLLAPAEQADTNAQTIENAGELHRDITATNHSDMIRQGVEMKSLVGGYGVFDAGNVGHKRPAAGGDEDGFGCHLAGLGLDAHRVRPGERGAGHNELGARCLQVADIDGVEAVDLAVLGRDQGRPVEFAVADGPAVPFGRLKIRGKMAGIDKELLGHAAANDASAADAVFLGDGDPGAVPGGDPACAHPARTGADDEKVVVEFSHGVCP